MQGFVEREATLAGEDAAMAKVSKVRRRTESSQGLSETVEQSAQEIVRVALLSSDGPTGTFTHATLCTIPW